jgi:hypothetical protein
MIESFFDVDENLHQKISFLDQDHKYKIRNENDDNYLAVDPTGVESLFNIVLVNNETHIYLSKPIIKDYISRIAYYLGFKFENCTLDIIPI